MAPKYVFILCPPFCGSTILVQLLKTSPNVSGLPHEGQYLEPVKHLMLPGKWNPERKFQWDLIKAEWEKFWDLEKPVLLEKSPPNILRAADIERVFSPACFIAMIRDPYALGEGLVRRRNRMFRKFRHGPGPRGRGRAAAMEFAAGLWVQFATCQMRNVRELQRVIHFTYEELTQDTPAVVDRIMTFLPELGSLDPGRKFHVHSVSGTGDRRLVNMNDTKWKYLRRREIEAINRVLARHRDCLDFFGYTMRQPDRYHDLRSVAIRAKAMVSQLTNEAREAVKDLRSGRRSAAKVMKRWRLLFRQYVRQAP